MQLDITGDVVNDQWLKSHGISIRRAEGVHQSKTAWVRIDHGVIIAAGVSDQRVISWLVDQGILSDGDIDYGFAFVSCRAAHRAYRKERGYKSCLDAISVGGADISCEQAAEIYSLMTRQLGQYYCKIVEYACDTLRTPSLPVNHKPPYRKAFSALGSAFRAAMDEVKNKQIP